MIDGRFWAWVGVAAVLVVLPGPDTMAVLRAGLRGGRNAALACAYGINTGLVVWMTASALGIAAVLSTSATAFTVLKIAGAVYLGYVGLRLLIESFRKRSFILREPRAAGPMRPRIAFRSGLTTNLLNPKIAATYTTLLPQFVEAGDPVVARTALLAGVFLVMGIVWLTVYAFLIGAAQRLFENARVRIWIERLTAGVFLAFAGQLITARRE